MVVVVFPLSMDQVSNVSGVCMENAKLDGETTVFRGSDVRILMLEKRTKKYYEFKWVQLLFFLPFLEFCRIFELLVRTKML